MMDFLRESIARIRAVFRKDHLDSELDSELATHLEMATEENIRAGMTPEEARRRAHIAIGGVEPARELHRDRRGIPWFETLMQDVRYSFRTLRRDAGLTTFAILIVGIGTGAASTVFNVFNALLVRPLPFSEPQRLVSIANAGGPGLSERTMQVNYVLATREQSKSFADVAAYFAFYGVGDSKLTGSGEPERLTNVPVSGNFFPLLGVEPILGRQFTKEECVWRGPKAVLLSYRFWQRRLNADPNIVGRPLTLDNEPVTVAGVLPASFDFGAVFAPGRQVDLFSPFPLTQETNRWGNTMFMVGRLKPGVTVESARSEMTVLGAHLTQANPQINGFRPSTVALRDYVSGAFRPAVLVLSCAVGILMLVVCTNLSNLLLARSTTREKEMVLRAALGAGKWRLVRQMLTESVLLSFAGATLGLILAVVWTNLLRRLDTVGIPLLADVRVDGAALAFTLVSAVLTGIAFGLTPAIRASGLSIAATLKESARGSSEGKSHGWLRNALVVSEIALACVLLVGAGLLIRSFLHVLDVDLGFRPESAVAMRIDPDSSYDTQAKRNSYFNEALRRVSEIRGVEAVGLTDALPLGRNRTWGSPAKGKTYSRGEFPLAYVRIVSDGYIRAMGIPIVAGRDIAPTDTPDKQFVIVINQSLARRLWPGEDPIGKIMGSDKERTVVGVVRDVRHLALEQAAGSEMYIPIRQINDYASVDIVARAPGRAADLAAAMRNALRPLDPNIPTAEFRTLQELVDRSVSPRRFVVLLLGGFAAFGLILASLGIYAVISYSVSRRRTEIGIRMALGASATELQTRILAQTLRLAAVGMLVGTLASWVAARVLGGLLYGVTSSDPITFAAMLALLTVVAAAAGYLPARRASRMNPLDALRAE